MKKRVKCANCGTIYDINRCEWDRNQEIGCCPKCKSNAYDVIRTHINWTKQ